MKAKEKEKEEQTKEQKQIKETSDQGAAATPSVTAKTGSGQIVVVKHISEVVKGNESGVKQKMDDESGNTQVIPAEVHMNPEPEDEASPEVEKPYDDDEPDSAGDEED